jgi:hypothetical protein
MCMIYLRAAFEQGFLEDVTNFDEYWNTVKVEFVKSVEKLVLVNSFYWSTWAVMMMPDENVCDDNAWQWSFLKGRNDSIVRQRKEFNL